MGFYSRAIFPRLVEFVMRGVHFTELRKALLAGARGEVLEIGFGSGLNLPHYPPGVWKLTTIDANPGMSPLAQKRIASSPIKVDHQVLDAERLPFPDGSFDTVVSTWTLCSIADIDQALREIHRVMKPEGRFLFIEHGLSAEPTIRKWQHRLTPLQKKVADGCHLDRDIAAIIARNGFKITELNRFYMKGAPRIAGFTYQGAALKS
ncbi:MAG: class I SAM-dependent methyltransferase [Candidatus Manganitrophaceae bacterium]|nr:MAG: class I SAM-dependent methyltransferase [Candidatus Manganitrophaceae bacterium]